MVQEVGFEPRPSGDMTRNFPFFLGLECPIAIEYSAKYRFMKTIDE